MSIDCTCKRYRSRSNTLTLSEEFLVRYFCLPWSTNKNNGLCHPLDASAGLPQRASISLNTQTSCHPCSPFCVIYSSVLLLTFPTNHLIVCSRYAWETSQVWVSSRLCSFFHFFMPFRIKIPPILQNKPSYTWL